jgi:RNA polymerase-binding transcription factor DksA
MAAQSELRRELQAKLLATRSEWEKRLGAIQADRRRVSAPLVTDSDDQAIQRENDATLDALDARGRQELAAVSAALERIAAGTYGTCLRCGESIPAARLRAEPTARTCLACARPESG